MTIKQRLGDIYLAAYDAYPVIVIATIANRIERFMEEGRIIFPEGADTLDFASLMELVRWFERYSYIEYAFAIWYDDGRSGVDSCIDSINDWK